MRLELSPEMTLASGWNQRFVIDRRNAMRKKPFPHGSASGPNPAGLAGIRSRSTLSNHSLVTWRWTRYAVPALTRSPVGQQRDLVSNGSCPCPAVVAGAAGQNSFERSRAAILARAATTKTGAAMAAHPP